MACAWLAAAGEEEIPAALRAAVDPDRWRAVASMARTGTAAPWTTSAGRLFDAVAALCGVRTVSRYEGQAAMELESLAARDERGSYEIPVVEAAGDEPRAGDDRRVATGAGVVLDARPLVNAVARDVAAGVAPAIVAARFHAGLADATAEACLRIAGARGLDLVALSGGVFGNRLLLERTCARLEAAGMCVLRQRRLPANDGGVAYGQAAIAAAVMAC
jgi:hydrogenase maturation protein HypF